MFKIIDNVIGIKIEITAEENTFKENIKSIIENYTSKGLGTKADLEGDTATIRLLKTEDLVDTLVFYDCDCSVENFDDWFYGVFMVDNLVKARWLFSCWLEEYMNSDELMEKTDRYQHIYRRARQYGYVAINPFGKYGGFGC